VAEVSASRRGGYFGTLLMGLTFSLTSFACVGPFVGPLLASSVQTQGVQPVVGMAAFATGDSNRTPAVRKATANAPANNANATR